MTYLKNKFQLRIKSVLISILFFNYSCGQDSKKEMIINNSLPKEITLNPKTIKIIDSIFVFKNDVQKLETVQLFELKKGILISGNRKYYVNDIINQTTNEVFNSNGNSIESNTLLHFKNSNQIFERKLDNYGNITQLISSENNNENVLEYKNTYQKNKLVEVSIISQKSGNIIEKTSYKYDSKGNIIEEQVNNSYLNAKNIYEYNNENQVILHKHIRNGTLSDSVTYNYNNGLLSKEEWYENQSINPMITDYYYNEKKQLTLEEQKQFGEKTEYRNYDSLNNWQIKEQYLYGKIHRLTKRIFINK